MACRLAPGHRLRLALSNSYWPFVWPSPQPAVLTLAGGHLDLPLHPGPLAGWEPPPPEAGQVQSLLQRDPPRAARRIEEDLLSGRVSLVVEEDSGTAENLAHGLTSRERMEERWEIAPDDPLSACATVRWDYAASRGEWSVRTRATARMTATADDLRMEAHLTAWEGEAEVFSRAWDVRVPRLLV
jgi:hypothetical protein